MRTLQYKHFFSQYSMQLLLQVKANQNSFVSIVLSTGLLEYFDDLFQHLGALFQQDCPDHLPPTIAPQCYTNDFFSPSIIKSAGTLSSGVQFYCLYTDFVWKSTMPGITPCWRFPLFLTLILSLHKLCSLYYCGTHKIDLCCHLPYATCWVVT